MVAAVMSELELVGLAAECKADELMSQADAKDRRAPHQAADIILRVVAWLRIAGTVGEKNAIRLERQHIF